MTLFLALGGSPGPTPFPTRTVIEPPPAGGFETAGAIVAILLAVAAAIVGYRIIRGGRGL